MPYYRVSGAWGDTGDNGVVQIFASGPAQARQQAALEGLMTSDAVEIPPPQGIGLPTAAAPPVPLVTPESRPSLSKWEIVACVIWGNFLFTLILAVFGLLLALVGIMVDSSY